MVNPIEPQRTEQLRELTEKIALEQQIISLLKKEISRTIIGQTELIDKIIVALLCNGHLLLEGAPGLAKTKTIKTVSDCLSASFSRIQFTPDLLPADLTGTQLFQQKSEKFMVKKGPIFASFVLADEINRAPAKVQSALLEAMQERQVTIGEECFPLPAPFLVMATQNPLEHEGTYPLPEAQLDRFMMKVNVEYPSNEEELSIIRQFTQPSNATKTEPVLKMEEISGMQKLVNEIYMDEKIERYIIAIVHATRNPTHYKLSDIAPFISFGASPRGSINLALTSKAYAFLQGRAFVVPEDVQKMAVDVLKHRIGLSYEAEISNKKSEHIVQQILSRIEVP